MAAKKTSRGPRVRTYVLKVNEETGQILETHVEDPATGKRIKVGTEMWIRSPVSEREKRIYGGIQPITRLPLRNLHIKPPTAPINPGPARKKRK